MNKLKLEVVKLANEDVIITSSLNLCTAHSDKLHAYTCGKTITAAICDIYAAGSITKTDAYNINFDSFNPQLGIKAAINKWYYLDDDFAWKECNGDHSSYTIESN